MDDCKIVTDLLPTYCDELTSWETNVFIRTHLKSCPNCSKLLEKMQQKREQQKDVELRQAEFKAAVAAYERNHRTRVHLLLLACLFLIAIFFAVRACSVDLAIAVSGLNREAVEVVQEPTTGDDGKMFQVIFSRTKEGHRALAYLTKNVLGFWSVDVIETVTPDQPSGVAQIMWSEIIPSFYDSEPHMTAVFHTVYAGTNAIGSFEQLPYEDLPGNVTVLATQIYSDYYIHVITVLPDGGTAFDILPLLKENNLIA